MTTVTRGALEEILTNHVVKPRGGYSNADWLLRPNPLRETLFRKRFGFLWKPEYQAVIDGDPTLINLVDLLAKRLREVYPGVTDPEKRFCAGALINDFQWTKSNGLRDRAIVFGIPVRPDNRGQPLTPTPRRRGRGYYIEVTGSDVASGTATFTCTRNYCGQAEVPEHVVEEAVREGDGDIIERWIRENLSLWDIDDSPEHDDYEYDNESTEESDHDDMTIDESNIDALMDAWIDENPDWDDEDEDEEEED